MFRAALVFTVIVLAAYAAHAQILPAPGAKLHYNQVMFEYGKVSGAIKYVVQVADSTGNSFNGIIAEKTDSATATLIGGLDFGKKYMWRYAGVKNGEQPVWNGPYYFEIDVDSFINKNIVNFVVTQNDTGNKGLIVIDGTHTIIDRNGKLVWYLTNVNWFYSFSTHTVTKNDMRTVYKDMNITPVILDLRLTQAGTITCLKDSVAAEYDLNGNKLWQAPNDGQVNEVGGEGYNHDFKRLPNGHYMVLGSELWRPLPAYKDTLQIKRKYPCWIYNGKEYGEVESGTIIEYDRNRKVVWSWNSRNYLDSDALKPLPKGKAFDYQLAPHINAFSIDKNGQYVYAGLRDISRVVKIEKATGRVADSWGSSVMQGGANHPVAFHLQHDANILEDGTLAVFNSNDYPGRDSIPGVMLLSQQATDSGSVIWQYNCEMDAAKKHDTRNGGNVDQLANGNLLVCMGNSDRIFEITRNKQIVWQGEIKMRDVEGTKYAHRLYRAHYISSLYPCYFVFDIDKDTVDVKVSDVHLHIFNKGSESDAYEVKVVTATGNVLKQFVTERIAANGSAMLYSGQLKHLHKGNKVEIRITSTTNPDFIRSRWVLIN